MARAGGIRRNSTSATASLYAMAKNSGTALLFKGEDSDKTDIDPAARSRRKLAEARMGKESRNALCLSVYACSSPGVVPSGTIRLFKIGIWSCKTSWSKSNI
jgi:hypothetical protein